MKTFFGNYREEITEAPTVFRFDFSADNIPFKWEYCGETADFAGEYLLGAIRPQTTSNSLSEEIIPAVKYIVNELMENALKFRSGSGIMFSCGLDANEIFFRIANMVSSDKLPSLISKIENISNGNTEAMLFEQIENNAASEKQTGSGLGYLTMINDYGARLGWKIERLMNEKENVQFETMVFLKITNKMKEAKKMEIKGAGYSLTFDEKTGEAFFKGTFRCSNEEYAEITKMMDKIIQDKPEKLLLDLTEMEFLNSSGINMFAKLVITMRNKGETALEMKGTNKFPWQGKSLPNLKKLYPAMTLAIQ